MAEKKFNFYNIFKIKTFFFKINFFIYNFYKNTNLFFNILVNNYIYCYYKFLKKSNLHFLIKFDLKYYNCLFNFKIKKISKYAF